MSFSFSSIFAEAELFISRASSIADQIPAEVQAASNALEAAKAAASHLENALKGIAPPAKPAAPASAS